MSEDRDGRDNHAHDQDYDHVGDLRRDLHDGDDLALAMTLIGDVLQRRIVRVRRSLGYVNQESNGIHRRIRGTLDRYEVEFRTSHDRMQEVIGSFQALLEEQGEAMAAQVLEEE